MPTPNAPPPQKKTFVLFKIFLKVLGFGGGKTVNFFFCDLSMANKGSKISKNDATLAFHRTVFSREL